MTKGRMRNRSSEPRTTMTKSLRSLPTVEAVERRRLLSLVPAGPEFRVNTYTTEEQYRATVAIDAEGNFLVAWTSFGQDGSGNAVQAQRYSASGVAEGEEFRVSTRTLDYQSFPAAAMDHDGDSLIAWHSMGQDGSGYGVYAQRYNSAGSPEGVEFRVNSYTTYGQAQAAVAMDADGDF